jgi:hypothetical protein
MYAAMVVAAAALCGNASGGVAENAICRPAVSQRETRVSPHGPLFAVLAI